MFSEAQSGLQNAAVHSAMDFPATATTLESAALGVIAGDDHVDNAKGQTRVECAAQLALLHEGFAEEAHARMSSQTECTEASIRMNNAWRADVAEGRASSKSELGISPQEAVHPLSSNVIVVETPESARVVGSVTTRTGGTMGHRQPRTKV